MDTGSIIALCTGVAGVFGSLGAATSPMWLSRANRDMKVTEAGTTLALKEIDEDTQIREERRREIEDLRKRIESLETKVQELLDERNTLREHKSRLEIANEALVQMLVLAETERDGAFSRVLALEIALEEHGGRPSQVMPRLHPVVQRRHASPIIARAQTLPGVRKTPGDGNPDKS